MHAYPIQGTSSILTNSSCRKFIFTKHYFWVSEEPSTAESLNAFLRSEKSDSKHSSASWARETGKGLLFYAKRAEDKAVPAGLINLVSTYLTLGHQRIN